MAGSLLVFAAILGGAVFAAAVWKRRVAEMLPLSVVFLMAHTLLCGQIGLLRFSAVFTPLVMIALGAVGLTIGLRKRLNLWDSSLLYFTLSFVWLVYISKDRLPLLQTDFTQWALAPKAMFTANTLALDGWALAFSPALAVLQYVFQACNALFAPDAGFEGWLLYVAGGTAVLALLTPFAHSAHPRRLVRAGYTLLYFLAAVCVPLLYFDLFSTLYPDGLLAILAAAAFLTAAREKSVPQAVITGLYLFALTLVKDAGLWFALGALLAYGITLRRSRAFRQAGRGQRIWMAALPPALVLLARLSWLHLSITLHGAAAAGETLRLFWESFAAKAVTVRMGLTLESGTLFSLFTAHLSFLALAVFLVCLTAWLLRAMRPYQALRDACTALAATAGSALLYMAGVAAVYLFAIDAADAAKMAGFERLTAIGVVCWSLVAGMSALRALEQKPAWPWRRHMLVILICVGIALTGSGTVSALTGRSFTADNEKYHTYYAVADTAQTVIPEDAKVYIVSQNDDGTAFAVLRYALCPRETNTGVTYWLRDPQEKQYEWTYPVTPEAWRAELADYDYVLVYRADDYLQTEIAAAVGAAIAPNTVYRVDGDMLAAVELPAQTE